MGAEAAEDVEMFLKEQKIVFENGSFITSAEKPLLIQIEEDNTYCLNENFDVEVVQIDAPSANLMYDDVAPIINYAMENRNEIKVAERDIELSKLSTKISKSAYLPNISMGYGFNASAVSLS